MKKIYAFFTITAVCCCLAFTAAASTHVYHDTLIYTTGSSKNAISIGSHRASGEIYLRVHRPITPGTILMVKDADGKMVLQQSISAKVTHQPILIDTMKDLPEGEFEVVLLTKETAYSTRFLVWK